MGKIVVRFRPVEVMEQINLDLIRQAMGYVPDWETELQDTRLSDAPYVTVIVNIPEINQKALARLQGALANLPGMRAKVMLAIGEELPLEAVDLAGLARAAAAWTQ
jgi:hypothetical protein